MPIIPGSFTRGRVCEQHNDCASPLWKQNLFESPRKVMTGSEKPFPKLSGRFCFCTHLCTCWLGVAFRTQQSAPRHAPERQIHFQAGFPHMTFAYSCYLARSRQLPTCPCQDGLEGLKGPTTDPALVWHSKVSQPALVVEYVEQASALQVSASVEEFLSGYMF